MRQTNSHVGQYGLENNNSLRIASQNVHGWTQYKSGMKNKQLREIIKEKDIDILLIQEISLYWPSVDQFDSWYERMKDLKGTRKSVI